MNASYFAKYIQFLFTDHKPSPAISLPGEVRLPICPPSDSLSIPALEIESPIVYVSGTTEQVFQDGLTRGVVHLPGSAEPGEHGNTYLFGHSSDFPWKAGDYKTVFAVLPEIKIGDQIRVSNRLGKLFVYAVTKTLVVGPKDLDVIDQHDKKIRMLSLQTSYPLGTALRRFIVQADFVEETACSQPD